MKSVFSSTSFVIIVGILFCASLALNAMVLTSFTLIQQIIKGILLIVYFWAFLQEIGYTSPFQKIKDFKSILFVFSFVIIAYGLFSNQIKQLFPVSSVLLIFWFSYHYTRKGAITPWMVKGFSILLSISAAWLIRDAIAFKLSYTTLLKAGGMNVGYTAVGAMLFLMLFYKKKWAIALIFISFILTLFALKRGAVISGLAIIAVIAYKYFKDSFSLNNIKIKHLFLLCAAIGILGYTAIQNQEILFHRMGASEMRTGSGRDVIYGTIWDQYKASKPTEILFGHGFFAVTYMKFRGYEGGRGADGFYAHSDFMELIWDHGILGIILYLILLVSMYRYLRHSEWKIFTLPLLLAILIKAYLSGVYCTLWGQFPFLLLGYMMGRDEYKYRVRQNTLYNERSHNKAASVHSRQVIPEPS